MIENKELPSEYVSIRAIWLKAIDDCRKAISQVANIEASSERREFQLAGTRTVVHTVDALYLSLVDYGEALVKSDVDRWKKEVYYPALDKIWDQKKKKKQSSSVLIDDDEEVEISITTKWWENFKLSKTFYEHMIQVLNKYGMLFQEQPSGYSNVIIEEIYGGENNI